jgi:hypothetical protein
MISPLLAPLRKPLNALKESTRQMARFIPNAAVQMKSASAAPRESSTSLPNCDRWDDAFRSREYLAGPPVLWRRDQPLVESPVRDERMRRDTHPLFERLRGRNANPEFLPNPPKGRLRSMAHGQIALSIACCYLAAPGDVVFSPCLPARARRHRVEAAGLALHFGALARLAQVQESGGAGGESRG